MDWNATPSSALVTALALAQEHGGADAALRAMGLDLDGLERFDGASDDLVGLVEGLTSAEAPSTMLALGFLAGRVAYRPRPRRSYDPTTFLMDRDLLIRGAEGESILRLPWIEEALFVGRCVPDLFECPKHVLRLSVDHYGAALEGERGQFSFTSYGHTYTVEAVPVRNDDREVIGVLAIAAPATAPAGRLRRASELERAADALEESARIADERAELYSAAGDYEAEEHQREVAEESREAARTARAQGFRQRSTDGPWHQAE
jgi:hypothetical protein